MKRTLYTTLLIFVVQALSFATPPRKKALDGYWHSHSNYENIKIDQNRYSLRVKNLFQHGWVRYQEIRQGVFKDYYGNIIRVHNRSEIVAKQKIRRRFGPDKYSRPIVFHKNRLRSCRVNRHNGFFNRNNQFDYLGGSCSSDYDFRYFDDRYDRDSEYRLRERRDRGRDHFDIEDIIGTWVSDNNVKVRIQKSGRGIKAKIIGKDKWDIYVKDGRNVFTNNRGSKYIFRGDELIWNGRNGKTRSFVKR